MSAGLLTKLIEAGTPAALVAEVALELGRAQAASEALEQRRKNERERKARSREVTGQNGTERDGAEVQEKGSLEVSPPAPPLPKPSKISPLNPPSVLAEKRQAVASCLRKAFPPPDGVSAEQWSAFRKQRKKSLNDRSYALVVKKLLELAAAGHDPGEMIDLAIERGWETVFEPKDFGPKGGKSKYVSAAGYEYRGDEDAVMREAQRRGDTQTYWLAHSNRSRKAQSIGDIAKRVTG